MRAETKVDQYFAGALGIDETTVVAAQSAMWGSVATPPNTPISGLRPLGLCAETLQDESDFTDWQNNGATSDPIRITYSKSAPNDCADSGGVSGNWGMIDFNGGSNSNSEAQSWLADGYDGPVSTGWYEGDPGALSGSHRSALQGLKSSGETFSLPIFSDATGNGANAEFNLVAFPRVQLTDFNVTGKQSKRYIELVFIGGFSDGACCSAPDASVPDFNLRGTRIVTLDATGQPILR